MDKDLAEGMDPAEDWGFGDVDGWLWAVGCVFFTATGRERVLAALLMT